MLSRRGDLLVAEHGWVGRVGLVGNELGRQVGRGVAAQSLLTDACIQVIFGNGGPFCDFKIGECLQRGLVVWTGDRGCVP